MIYYKTYTWTQLFILFKTKNVIVQLNYYICIPFRLFIYLINWTSWDIENKIWNKDRTARNTNHKQMSTNGNSTVGIGWLDVCGKVIIQSLPVYYRCHGLPWCGHTQCQQYGGPCKAKRQYLLTCEVSRSRLLALQGSIQVGFKRTTLLWMFREEASAT